MFQKLGDASGIETGDEFAKFLPDLEVFREGIVTNVDAQGIVVDFGDFRIQWPLDEIGYYAQTVGIYREFYSSPTPGNLLSVYRAHSTERT